MNTSFKSHIGAVRQAENEAVGQSFTGNPLALIVNSTPVDKLEQARALQEKGDVEGGMILCREIVAEKPDNAEALELLGTLALQRKNHALAIDSLTKAIKLNPNNSTLHAKMGSTFLSLSRYNDALASFDRALVITPESVKTWFERGLVLQKINRNEEALFSYDRAVTLKPDYVEALSNRGNVLNALKRYEEALESYEQALACKSHSPFVHLNRGATLQKLNRNEEAIESCNRAMAINPDYVEALSERGNAFLGLGQHDRALASYAHALAIDPAHVAANFNECFCQLLLGNFDIGWQKFEWRWHTKQLSSAKRKFPKPVWFGGESLRHKTILLHAEQGLGDTLQFCRYVKWVAALGAKVLLEVQPPLKSLLVELEGVSGIYVRGETLPHFDFHCPLMSLPLAHKTSLSSIPADIAYLRCDQAHADKWEQRLGKRKLPRIGICWSGSTGHVSDHNRSIPFEQFADILSDGAEFFCLQKELRESDKKALERRDDVQFFGEELKDFSDTAALIALMDVVITVDTSVAHLAGALGKPVWILLPFAPDWRWLTERNDSPWYPTAKLFRQSAVGDWGHAIVHVAERLRESIIG